MKNFGFVKVAAAVPTVKVADCAENASRIISLMQRADKEGVEIVGFPELSVSAYTCADLFASDVLLDSAVAALHDIVLASSSLNLIAIVGLPLRVSNSLYNCAAVVSSGKVIAVVPKTFLPNYNEFYERRWFASAAACTADTVELFGEQVPFGTDLLISTGDYTFSIEICEDLWTTIPPSSLQALAGAQLIFNLSASDDITGKNDYRRTLVSQQSARCIAAMVYASAGFGESSTDLLYAGSSIIAENGSILAEGRMFSMEPQLTVTEVDIERLMHDRRKNTAFGDPAQFAGVSKKFRTIQLLRPAAGEFTLTRRVDPMPFVPAAKALYSRCEEILSIQSQALAVRLHHTGIRSAVVGISGGLDSTLALLVTVQAFDSLGLDRSNIIGITMPGFGTTTRTKNNALTLLEGLKVTCRTISIADACRQHFADIGHDINITDITYENTQARERTQILMDIANQCNGLVIGTGDMSELALGWATYNGDHMSMYAVNAGVPKTLVRHLVSWYADNLADEQIRLTLRDIVDTPISPELLPADDRGQIAQKTEDLVGPYELHDFFLYYFLRFGFAPSKIFFLARHAFAGLYEEEVILKWLKTFVRRFFTQQFKRSCMPDGPKVGSVNLSPRGDWRMPSDASSSAWQKDLGC